MMMMIASVLPGKYWFWYFIGTHVQYHPTRWCYKSSQVLELWAGTDSTWGMSRGPPLHSQVRIKCNSRDLSEKKQKVLLICDRQLLCWRNRTCEWPLGDECSDPFGRWGPTSFTWLHLVPPGSPGSTWFHLVPFGSTWFHLVAGKYLVFLISAIFRLSS